MFTITLLGTSDAVGTPVHGCACARCQDALAHPWLRRLPTCVLIQNERASILVDMGANDHIHNLRSVHLDAVFVTHFHMDHVAGLYTLRWTQQAGGLPCTTPRALKATAMARACLPTRSRCNPNRCRLSSRSRSRAFASRRCRCNTTN
ncbi:MAG: MBL fold metallo-hydrolase [Anaerolineae bacterium]|nr:MBL fold metallo-hydrolase [Anaerolineae bacterium]